MKVTSVAIAMLMLLLQSMESATAGYIDDEEALKRLFNISGGPRWSNATNWWTTSSVCTWYGIACDEKDHVTSISLSHNNLVGHLPKHLYQMEHLTKIELENNFIRNANFPGFAEARDANGESKLELLNLASNTLTGVVGIGDAPTTLKELHFTDNKLKGTFPAELFNLTNIQVLFLSYNDFTGTLPTEIGKLEFLERFYLYDNDLSGAIPSEIGLLKTVQIFTLAENRFSGTLSRHVSSMVNLQTFSIHNNEFKKEQLSGHLPSFDKSPYLTTIKLDGNNLSGSIPHNFLHGSNATDSLVTIGLSGNRLTGSIPTTLLRFTSLQLDLTGNQISEIDPLFCKKGAWMSGLVEELGCDAILCPIATWSTEGRNTETSECTACESAFYFGSTECVGAVVPDGLALAKLYEATSSKGWNVTTGWNTLDNLIEKSNWELNATTIDVCNNWYGVKCSNGAVNVLELKNNGLVGTIPSELFSLAHLKILDLSLNAIKADEFGLSAIANAKTLQQINLSGTKITTIAGIGSASNFLTSIYLDALELPQGPFPEELLTLTNLHLLHMHFSRLNGTLPTTIGNLKLLKSLNIANNHLTGPVPTEIGQLHDLTFLELSGNNFEGALPQELDGMDSIREIHIGQATAKGNRLTGKLPSFESIQMLTKLTLDHNRFTGQIPDKFLSGIANKSYPLYVNLAFNELSGIVPSGLDHFSELDILLEGNKITGVSMELCNNFKWMNGNVGLLGNTCDAILCPKEKYNVDGKSGEGSPCLDCPSVTYYGSVKCDGVLENNERKILDNLFHSTGGRHWSQNANWTKQGVPICRREGITCADKDADSGVMEIEMVDNNLSGEIPSDIFDLPHVELLSFTDDQVDLSFANIAAAKKLKALKLSNTNLRSLDGIHNAPSTLEELHVGGNQLTGTIPSEVFHLSSLRKAFLNDNLFTGTIATEIGQMTRLIQFICSSNMLTGEIPTELGMLAELSSLSLEQNSLSGNLPLTFDQLTKLAVLKLHDQADRTLSGPLLSFSNNSALTTIALDNNDLTGTIPSDFLENVANDAAVRVYLAGNRIGGSIPSSLSRFNDLTIDLADNEIVDLGNACEKKDWMEGMVNRYGCNAILCAQGYFAERGRQVESSKPCEPCPGLMGDFFGATECNSRNERDILIELYASLNGTNWLDQTNWLVDEDHCTWYGIVCDAYLVSEINLASNGLVAISDVSSLIFNLRNLTKLDLKGNEVPLDLKEIPSSSKLRILMLSSTGLQSSTGIGKASDLRRLHLTDNFLSGTFPKELLSLSQLRTLYLSFNSLSGPIPDQINKLANLEEFYAYGNMFNGTLPNDSIAQLINLREFIVPDNYLEGTIPTAFNSLPRLEQLSLFDQLSATPFNGPIPSFLGAPNLWFFDASNNDLTGSIPSDFMQNSVNLNKSVAVYLSNNELTGELPLELARFTFLDIMIVGNKISSISSEFCNKSGWMDGDVGIIGSCDAIACPPGSYAPTGRQESSNEYCEPCDNNAIYYGTSRCQDVSEERRTLIDLFTNTGGSSWKSSTNWGTNEPICNWEGISCDEGNADDDSGVTGVLLEDNGLIGTMPATIWKMPLLKSLNVKSNTLLHVNFHELPTTNLIETLYLSEVRVDSVAGLENALKLKEIHLTGCGLSGPFPSAFFNIASSLEAIFIAYNSFTGTLPTQLGELQNLKSLYAYENEFSGSLPTQIGLMTNLNEFVLSANLITGKLPTEVSELVNLQLFSIYRDGKPGPGLSGSLPSFNKNPQLSDLRLEGNSLTGEIPRDFLRASHRAHRISLGQNSLSGELPSSLGALNLLSIELEDNMISSFPKSFCNKTSWMDGAVASQGCDGLLCPVGFASPMGRASKNGTIKCSKCSGDGDAKFYGSTTCSPPVDERQILVSFFQKCGGTDWINNTGWTTFAPFCEWYGVDCTGSSVVGLYLGSNNLVGTPPPELFTLPRLRTLELFSNPIAFEFANIEAAKELTSIRIDSTGLGSIKGISKAQALSFVDLRFNSIQGRISEELFQLKNLRFLNVGNNKLTGTLPPFFSKLSYLKSLRLGNNQLSGGLPNFEKNAALTSIDLSDNRFNGTIPRNFLDRLTLSTPLEIDLSGNQLSGWVPGELDRFADVKIYLRKNQISDMTVTLCDNYNWNEGDVGRFGCNGLLCPPGTFNSVGRERDGEPCLGCLDTSPFYGQTMCSNPKLSSGTKMELAWIIGAAVALVSSL